MNIILIILIICFVCYVIIDNNNIKIIKNKIKLNRKKHSSYKILQVSDLHDRKFGGTLAKKINNQNVDAIVFTGDIENDTIIKNKHTFIPFLHSLTKDVLKIYVDGNNGKKTFNMHTGKLTPYGKILETLGVQILTDFYVLENEKICFVNTDVCRYITDLTRMHQGEKVKTKPKRIDDIQFNIANNPAYKKDFIEKLLKYKEEYTIIGVGHYPYNIHQMYDISRSVYDSLFFDLNLCGHYHGGQFVLPFFNVIFVPSINSKNDCYFPKREEIEHIQYVNGIYQNISKGLGSSSGNIKPPILAFRLFNTPEMDIIEIE